MFFSSEVILYMNQLFDQYRFDMKIDIEWNVYRDVHCRSFSLRSFSANVTKSVRNYGFGHIYRRNPEWKTSFLCSGI